MGEPAYASTALARLTSEAMHLEVYVPSGEAAATPHTFATLIGEQCARLGVELPLAVHELEVLLLMCPRDQWFVLCSGEEPTAPMDGAVELLVPVPVATARQRALGRRHAVRAGTLLARLHPGVPGAAGRDLRGRAILPRAPREARLPQGANTGIGEGGTALVACCDGEVLLRNLQIDVVPMYVHEGDFTRQEAPLRTPGAVFVTGSVREQATIEAAGEIYVQGDVYRAQLRSRGGSITVVGAIAGAPSDPCQVRAHGDIVCGSTLHSRLTAGGNIHLHDMARQSTFRAVGALFLTGDMAACLQEVRLQVEGGIFPPRIAPAIRATPLSEIPRQHVRVSTRLRALMALHGAPPLTFRACAILNLSISGARCHLPDRECALEPGTIVQLKFMLPDSTDFMAVIAQVARQITAEVVGVEFLQMTQQDQDHLTTYCLQLLLKRTRVPGAPA